MIFLQSAIDASGQVQCVTSGTVTSFNGPQAYVGDNPLVSTDAVAATDSYVGGLRYKSDGALRIYEGAGEFVNAGLAVTAQGQFVSGASALTLLYCSGNSLTTLNVSTNTALTYLDCNANSLNQANVDGILADLDSAGLSSGTVDLSGGTNAVPSAAGLISKTSLEGKGWSVSVNV